MNKQSHHPDQAPIPARELAADRVGVTQVQPARLPDSAERLAEFGRPTSPAALEQGPALGPMDDQLGDPDWGDPTAGNGFEFDPVEQLAVAREILDEMPPALQKEPGEDGALLAATRRQSPSIAPMRKIAATTQRNYQRVVKALWSATAGHIGLPTDVESMLSVKPIEVLSYLRSRASGDVEPRLARSTVDIYRSALLWNFRSRADNPAYAEALAELALMHYPSDQAAVQRRALRRTKRVQSGIPAQDLEDLVDALIARDLASVWGRRTALWLIAGVLTGLRPGEWEFAEWADEARSVLKVRTSKIKEDIAPVHWNAALAAAREQQMEGGQDQPPFGPDALSKRLEDALAPVRRRLLECRQSPHRFLPVQAQDRPYVLAHMQEVGQAMSQGSPFERYYDTCRKTLWRACRLLWGKDNNKRHKASKTGRASKPCKRYNLYDARHQFSANLRFRLQSEQGQAAAAAGGSGSARADGSGEGAAPATLAAILMGHSSARTTSRSYAPARRAWGASRPGQSQQQGDWESGRADAGDADGTQDRLIPRPR